MKYSKSQLNLIYDKKPVLIKNPKPTLNNAIVAFLKKNKVYVTPHKGNRAIDESNNWYSYRNGRR